MQLICKELELGRPINRSRYLQRLTPITVTGKATEKDLEEIAKAVVQPVLGASCPARQVSLHYLSERFDVKVKHASLFAQERHGSCYDNLRQ